jgi:hypothetical protein
MGDHLQEEQLADEQVPHPSPPVDPLKDPDSPAVRVPNRENFLATFRPPQSGQVTFFFSLEERKRTSKTLSHGVHTNSYRGIDRLLASRSILQTGLRQRNRGEKGSVLEY